MTDSVHQAAITLTDEQAHAIHRLPYVRSLLLDYADKPTDSTALPLVKHVVLQASCFVEPALQHAYAEGRKDESEEHGWRLIESAPKDAQVLVTWGPTWATGHPHIEVCECSDGIWFYSFDGDSPTQAPTHWMPLPSNPAAHG